MAPNLYVMAADNSPALLTLLRDQPGLAKLQDEHGYSLVHAAASYNHLDLLRTLVREFHAPVDLRDEDAETALFFAETVEAARCLVEELGLDAGLRGDLGLTAAEKMAAEDEFPDVVEYLRSLPPSASSPSWPTPSAAVAAAQAVLVTDNNGALPPPPHGMSVNIGTVAMPDVPSSPLQPLQPSAVSSSFVPAALSVSENGVHQNENGAADDVPPPSLEFRRRIEELASRPDFHTEQGQAALRELVEEALAGRGFTEDRSVRPRQH